MRRIVVLLGVSCAALVLSGCGSDSSGTIPPGGNSLVADKDIGQPAADVADTPDEGTTAGEDVPVEDMNMPPTGPNSLTYADSACTSPCPIELDTGVTVQLGVVYKDAAGEPIDGALVSFDTAATELLLGAKTAYTGDDGKAEVSVSAVAGSKGTFDVSASVSGDTDAGALRFSLTATAEAPAPLKVAMAYSGKASVTVGELRLFLQEGGKPICSDVHPDVAGAKPTPVLVKSDVALSATTTFGQLPGLDENTTTQTWMVQAVLGTALSPVATGCVMGVQVDLEHTEEATVTLSDLPLKFEGVYDVTTDVDLYTGVGGDGAEALGWIIGIFDSPGATALKAACAYPSGFLATACGFLVDGNGDPAGVGVSVAELGDEAFFSLLAKNLGEDFVFTGNSVAALLKEMQLRSTLTFASEPTTTTDTGAAFDSGSVSETWDIASYYWKFGLGCAPDDENCGLTVVKLSDVYGYNLVGDPEASVTTDNTVQIEQHTIVGFNYGTLLNFIIEKQILPSLFGDGTNELPPIDSYGDLVATVFGDDLCLLYDDCCEFFATKVADQIPDYIAIPACSAAIPAADFFIRDLITGLGGPLTIGTKAGAPCPAVDLQGDRTVDTLGQAEAKCEWDANFDISGSAFTPDNSWFGKHK